MPDDQFYLPWRPHHAHTHDCFYHNTGSCQGELVNSQVHVTITTADGIVIVNRDATTYANGFIGFWCRPAVRVSTSSGRQVGHRAVRHR